MWVYLIGMVTAWQPLRCTKVFQIFGDDGVKPCAKNSMGGAEEASFVTQALLEEAFDAYSAFATAPLHGFFATFFVYLNGGIVS